MFSTHTGIWGVFFGGGKDGVGHAWQCLGLVSNSVLRSLWAEVGDHVWFQESKPGHRCVPCLLHSLSSMREVLAGHAVIIILQ